MSAEESLYLMLREPWQKLAACRGMGPENFYLDLTDPLYEDKLEIAQRICSNCPVQADCEDYSNGNSEEWGIWNGVNLEDRLNGS